MIQKPIEIVQPWPVDCERCDALRQGYPHLPEAGVYSQHYDYHIKTTVQPDNELTYGVDKGAREPARDAIVILGEEIAEMIDTEIRYIKGEKS